MALSYASEPTFGVGRLGHGLVDAWAKSDVAPGHIHFRLSLGRDTPTFVVAMMLVESHFVCHLLPCGVAVRIPASGQHHTTSHKVSYLLYYVDSILRIETTAS